MKENLYEIIIDFSKEKGLDHEVVKKLVEQSLIQAAQRKLPYQEIEGQIDEKTGKINLYHFKEVVDLVEDCLLYTSPSPRDRTRSRMPSSA